MLQVCFQLYLIVYILFLPDGGEAGNSARMWEQRCSHCLFSSAIIVAFPAVIQPEGHAFYFGACGVNSQMFYKQDVESEN